MNATHGEEISIRLVNLVHNLLHNKWAEAKSERTEVRLLDCSQYVNNFPTGLEHLAGEYQQLFANVGQPDAVPIPFKDFDSQIVFENSNLTAYVRLALPNFLCAGGERLFLCDGNHILQMTEFEILVVDHWSLPKLGKAVVVGLQEGQSLCNEL